MRRPRFSVFGLFVGLAFLGLLCGWFRDRSQLIRLLDQERNVRDRAAERAESATKAYREAEAMIEQDRAEREKEYDAMAQIARMLPITPELKIANLQADLSQSRDTFLELGKLGASFRVFRFYYGDFTGAELSVQGGEVTDELATRLTYCGIQRIWMLEVKMGADAKAILTEQYDYSFDDGLHIFQLREKVRPPLARRLPSRRPSQVQANHNPERPREEMRR